MTDGLTRCFLYFVNKTICKKSIDLTVKPDPAIQLIQPEY